MIRWSNCVIAVCLIHQIITAEGLRNDQVRSQSTNASISANAFTQIDCGIPQNITSLPEFAQEELREIWRSYIPGSPCQREIEIQSDIFDVVKSFESDGTLNKSGPGPAVDSVQTTTTSTTLPPDDYDYDHIAANGGTPIPLLSASTESPSKKQRSSSDLTDDDYLEQTTFDDVAMMQFDSVNAPFLQSASNSVKHEFEKIWNDQDIPSESLRSLKIQTLAVSLLSSSQLTEYNRWATKRRKVLKAREQEMRHLSPSAKDALRKMSSFKARDPGEQLAVPIAVKAELTTFVQKLNRRRNLKLVH